MGTLSALIVMFFMMRTSETVLGDHIFCEWVWQELPDVNWFDPNNRIVKVNPEYAFVYESDQPNPLVDQYAECKNVNQWNQITVDINQDMNTVTVKVKPRGGYFGAKTRVSLKGLPVVVTGFRQTSGSFPEQIIVFHSASEVSMIFPRVNAGDSEKIALFAIDSPQLTATPTTTTPTTKPSSDHIFCEWVWQELPDVNWFDPNNRIVKVNPEYAFVYESDQPNPLVDQYAECKNVNQWNQITVDINQDMNTVTVKVKPRGGYFGAKTRVSLKGLPVVVTGFRQTSGSFPEQIIVFHSASEVSMIFPRVNAGDSEKIALFAIDSPQLTATPTTTTPTTKPSSETDKCNSNPCQNEGTCIEGIERFFCQCECGFTGNTCEEDINECSPNTCQNGGTCIDGINDYTCNCTGGIIGLKCEIDADSCRSSPCKNSGTCISAVNRHVCICDEGFTGANCETPVQPVICEPVILRGSTGFTDLPPACTSGECIVKSDQAVQIPGGSCGRAVRVIYGNNQEIILNKDTPIILTCDPDSRKVNLGGANPVQDVKALDC